MNIFSKKKIYVGFFAFNLFSLSLLSSMIPSVPLCSRKFGTQSLDNDRAGNVAGRNLGRAIVPAQPLNCSLDSSVSTKPTWVHSGSFSEKKLSKERVLVTSDFNVLLGVQQYSEGSNSFVCDLQETSPGVFVVIGQPDQQANQHIQSMPLFRNIEFEEEMESQNNGQQKVVSAQLKKNEFFLNRSLVENEKLNLFSILQSSLDYYETYEQVVLALHANPFCPVLGQDSDGRTPVHYALAWPDLGIADLLINEFGGFILNVQDKHGLSVFHYAVRSKTPSKVEYLLKKCKGIDVDLEDQKGRTSLMMVIDAAVNNRPAAREGRQGTERCKGAGSWNITQEMMKILVKYSSTANLTKVLTIANNNKKKVSRTLELEWKRCVTTPLTKELSDRRKELSRRRTKEIA